MSRDAILDRRDRRVNYFTGPSHWTGAFDDAYKPLRLQNWEVPKPFLPGTKIKRPVVTLVNDFGQFKVGIPKSRKNLWGNYVGTWHYPKKITREFANKMTGLDKLIPEYEDPCKDRAKNIAKETTVKKIPKTEEKQVKDVQHDSPKVDDEKKPKDNPCPIHDM